MPNASDVNKTTGFKTKTKAAFTPEDTSIPDEQLVSGYKWIQLVSGLHVSGVNAA